MTVKKTLVALTLVAVLGVGAYAATQVTGHRPWAGHRARRMEFLATYLDLTDAQRTQAKAIVQEARTNNQPLLDQLKQGRQDMMAAIKANKPESDLKMIADSQASVQSQLKVQRALAAEKLWALLTPDQQAKAEKLRNHFLNRLQNFRQPPAE